MKPVNKTLESTLVYYLYYEI